MSAFSYFRCWSDETKPFLYISSIGKGKQKNLIFTNVYVILHNLTMFYSSWAAFGCTRIARKRSDSCSKLPHSILRQKIILTIKPAFVIWLYEEIRGTCRKPLSEAAGHSWISAHLAACGHGLRYQRVYPAVPD